MKSVESDSTWLAADGYKVTDVTRVAVDAGGNFGTESNTVSWTMPDGTHYVGEVTGFQVTLDGGVTSSAVYSKGTVTTTNGSPSFAGSLVQGYFEQEGKTVLYAAFTDSDGVVVDHGPMTLEGSAGGGVTIKVA